MDHNHYPFQASEPAGGGVASGDEVAINGGDDFPTNFEFPECSMQSENTPAAETTVPAADKPRQSVKGAKAAKKRRHPEQAIDREIIEFFDQFAREGQVEVGRVFTQRSEGDLSLYRFLALCLEFVRDARFDVAKFALYCKEQNLPCTKATKRNVHLCAIRATAPKLDNKVASKYAAALEEIRRKVPVGGDVVGFLRDKGGVEGCLKAARREERASAGQPAAPPDRRLSVIGVPEGLVGTVAIVVAIRDGKARFVSCVAFGPGETAAETAAHVPAAEVLGTCAEPGHDPAASVATEVAPVE